MTTKLQIVVSECLLGRKVRWDGSDYSDALSKSLNRPWIQLKGICPEVGIGLGVPREPIHLVDIDHQIRVMNAASRERDFTDQLRSYVNEVVPLLRAASGIVLTEYSPSCGTRNVKVYSSDGKTWKRTGRGIYADEVMRRFPCTPIVDARDLGEVNSVETFLRRSLFCYVIMRAKFQERMQLIVQAQAKTYSEAMTSLEDPVRGKFVEKLCFTYLGFSFR